MGVGQSKIGLKRFSIEETIHLDLGKVLKGILVFWVFTQPSYKLDIKPFKKKNKKLLRQLQSCSHYFVRTQMAKKGKKKLKRQNLRPVKTSLFICPQQQQTDKRKQSLSKRNTWCFTAALLQLKMHIIPNQDGYIFYSTDIKYFMSTQGRCLIATSFAISW